MSNAPTRLVLWALSVVLLRASSSALAAPAPDNLVENPSCEKAADEDRPAGWTYSYSSGGTCDFVVGAE